MKVASVILPFLYLLLLLGCGKDNEVLPVNKEKIKVLTKRELRTSYGHVSFDSFEYDNGRINRIVYPHDSEMKYFYEGNAVKMFRVNNGELYSEIIQEMEFDSEQRLKEIYLISLGSLQYQYENNKRIPSTSSGTFNATFTFDVSGNLIHHEYPTPWGHYEHVYLYDENTNPQRYLQHFEFDYLYFSKNNVTNYKFYRDGVLEFERDIKYEYDGESYPVRMLLGRDTTLFHYSYVEVGK